jgi:hypothetical protein
MMTRFSSPYLSLLVTRILICVSISVWVYGQNRSPSDRFLDLAENFYSLKSFQIEAQVILVKNDENIANVVELPSNTFNFFGAGVGEFVLHKGYRDSSHILGPWDREVAWNGSLYQHYQKEGAVPYFSYISKNSPNLNASIENPLFLPIAFLSKDSDEVPGWNFRLQDVVQDELWEPAFFKASFSEKDIDNIVRVPGQILEGNKTFYLVEFMNEPDFLPKIITHINEGGSKIYTMNLEYEKYEVDKVPRFFANTIRFEYHNPESQFEHNGSTYNRTLIKIMDLQINDEIPDSLFTLKPSVRDVIWDGNINAFVQDMNGSPLPKGEIELDRGNTSHLLPNSSFIAEEHNDINIDKNSISSPKNRYYILLIAGLIIVSILLISIFVVKVFKNHSD